MLTYKKYRCVKPLHVTAFSVSTLLFVPVTVATLSQSFLRPSQSLCPALSSVPLLCIYPCVCDKTYIYICFWRVTLEDEQSK